MSSLDNYASYNSLLDGTPYLLVCRGKNGGKQYDLYYPYKSNKYRATLAEVNDFIKKYPNHVLLRFNI